MTLLHSAGSNNWVEKTQHNLNLRRINSYVKDGETGKENFCNVYKATYIRIKDVERVTRRVYKQPPFNDSPYYSVGSRSGIVIPPLSQGWTANEDAKLYSELSKKFLEHEFNASTALAEIDKTVRELGKFAGEWDKFIHAVHKKSLPEAWKVLKRNYNRLARSRKKRLQRARLKADEAHVKRSLHDERADPHFLTSYYNIYRNEEWPTWRKHKDYCLNRARAAKKSWVNTINDLRQNIGGAWLAICFGWEPLISDTIAGAEAVGSLVIEPLPKKSIKAAYSKISTGENADCKYIVKTTHYVSVLMTQTRSLRRGIDTSVISSKLIDPRQVAWERLSYSWLVDYVIPIGSYLAALDFVETYLTGTICAASLVESKLKGKAGKITKFAGYDDTVTVNNWTETTTVFQRAPSTAYVGLPTIKAKISDMLTLRHSANITALFLSRKGTIKRFT